MKVLIITSGLLPLPATKGGAVEDLMQHFIKQNEVHQDFKIIVISTHNELSLGESVNYQETQFIFTKKRLLKPISQKFRKGYRKGISLLFNKRSNILIHPCIIKAATQAIKENEFDKVIVLNISESILPLRQVYQGNLVLYLHNDNLNQGCIKAKQIFSACDEIFVVSDYIGKQVLKIKSSSQQKIKMISNGRDLSQFLPLCNAERQQIRAKWGVRDEEKLIVFNGRLHPLKGVYELILAVKKSHTFEQVKLMIIGGTFYSSNQKNCFIKKLEKIAQSMSNRVIFTGYVRNEEVPGLLMAADIGVVPTLSQEPSGLSVLEVQAAGLPLIATRVGGIPEITSPETSHLIQVDQQFIANLAKAIDRLVENDELRQKMGAHGRIFTYRYSVENYYHALKQAIQGGKSNEDFDGWPST